MSAAPRIALIIVWTGPWKPWINLYVETCRRNPDFDFLIFTDQPPPAATAPNVRYFAADVAAFARRGEATLGLAPNISRGYKFCDFRPAFGRLFAAELRGYTHWGYCDEDLLWGRLSRFLPASLFAEYDIVSSLRCSIAGQLTIFRNAPPTNSLFEQVPGWRALLAEPGTLNFSETIIDQAARAEEARGRLRVWRHQIQISDLPDESWDAWANRLELAEHGRRHPRLPAGPVLWRDGAIFDAAGKNEYAFFHFKTWKRTAPLPFAPPPPAELAEWRFAADGIRFVPAPGASPATLEYVRAYAAATATIRRRLSGTRLAAGLAAPWKRLRHAVARRLRS